MRGSPVTPRGQTATSYPIGLTSTLQQDATGPIEQKSGRTLDGAFEGCDLCTEALRKHTEFQEKLERFEGALRLFLERIEADPNLLAAVLVGRPLLAGLDNEGVEACVRQSPCIQALA